MLVCFGLGFTHGSLTSRVFCLFVLENLISEQIGQFGGSVQGLLAMMWLDGDRAVHEKNTA